MPFGLFKKKKKDAPKGSPYYNLMVKEVVRETADAVTIIFEQPENRLDYRPGQFITLIQIIDNKKIRRAYSLCSSPFLEEDPAVTIKRVENGAMSNHVNDHLKAGDMVEIMEPMGSFTLDINASNNRQVFLFGGGSGITPLLSIAKSILKEEAESKVVLVYANRDKASVIFKNQLEDIENEHAEKFKLIHFLEDAPSNWLGFTGYMTIETLSQIIKEQTDEAFSDKEYMTCGPEPMMNVVMETLKQLNVPEDKRHMESFVAGNTSPKEIIDMDALPDRTVKVLLEGQEYEYLVPKGKSILEAGLDENIDIPYSCQSGLCTACRGKCLQGSVRMEDGDGLSAEEKEQGYVLLCVSHAETDDVLVEIG